ncbi:unnamed protein product (macronuclear) [Paramecium tetraurelia]|uniref:Uncharacterized protein n=1 Tax=Paramecium tetraurelia TaxID=5888 RepID=A0C5C9_PARTE|nr:uncharacterized protein GSPATT00006495001 [Paramecium tetraurelia]CAK65996.1 unnamed protein product [Paramecium tetraurelia]|eukprot:XP_001433393.1 hypothetical protein (macronuclear) [Paramecium tetraurelia strain d4-2]
MFKPKSQKDQQQQPFYLSWFANQGENPKRGGTAPNQSRKDKLSLKSPYQQPLITVSHQAPNPYTKAIQPPKSYQSNIQQISKIYAGSFQGMMKRRSVEKRYDDAPKSGRASFKPSRTFTQQNSRAFHSHQQLNTFEPKFQCDNVIAYNYEDPQLTPRDNDDVEIMEVDNVDIDSNESNEADSEGDHNLQLPTQQQEEPQIQKNKSFVQKQLEEPIISMRKATATLNRPQTSEGARRKRFANSTNEVQQNTTEKKDSEFQIFDCHANIIQEDDSENQEMHSYYNQLFITFIIQDLLSIRSGQRRKPTDNFIDNLDNNDRPPSRHKTPPKATGLDLPLEAVDSLANHDIPIKNMYAQIDDKVNNNFNDDLDEFDLGFFKMNNKFQSKDGYHTDEGKKNNINYKHPQSANLKFNNIGLSNLSYSPLSNQITSAHGFRANEPQIVIKYNNSSSINKNQAKLPVKVPFQTSLGQDFLCLFANDGPD